MFQGFLLWSAFVLQDFLLCNSFVSDTVSLVSGNGDVYNACKRPVEHGCHLHKNHPGVPCFA